MNILREADKLITGSRQKTYGNVRHDYERTAALFKLMSGVELTTEQAILFMVCVKLSREGFKHGHDNCVDCAGYLSLYADAVEGKV